MKNIIQTIKDMPKTFVNSFNAATKNKYVQKAALGLAGIGVIINCLTGCGPNHVDEKIDNAKWGTFYYGGVNPMALAEFEGFNISEDKERYLRRIYERSPENEQAVIRVYNGEPMGKLELPDADDNQKIGTSYLNYVFVK